jgi:hypothetical protein
MYSDALPCRRLVEVFDPGGFLHGSHFLEASLHIDPTLLSSVSALLGALVGGAASLVAAIYTQRRQDRLQRVAFEVAKRETVYADFVMSASNLLLNAYTKDEMALGSDEQRLIGLINRMRLFAPPDVVVRSGGGAQSHCRDLPQPEYRASTTRQGGVVQEP